LTRSQDEASARRAVVTVCRRLWERGLVAGQDGNVSVRLGRDILVTPSGYSKIDVRSADLLVVGLDGSRRRGRGRPSSEIALHLRAYARRPDVAAVVHAHPPTATALSVAGETIPERVLPEIALLLGQVPLVPYATPGTEALADRFEPFWAGHDAFLMANHGALTLGTDLRLAHQRMETLEHAARVVSTARAIGRVNELSTTDLRALEARRNEYRG
jgi:L-fuculose-phosphate aldolase